MKWLIPVFSVATGTWGGMTRIAAITDEAKRAGHEVAFCASGYLEAALRRQGQRVYPLPEPTFLGLPVSVSRLLQKNIQHSAPPLPPGRSVGNLWFVMLIAGFGRGRYLRRVIDAELAAARDFGADLIFTDLDLGAWIAGRIAGLPVAHAYQGVFEQGVGSLPWRIMRRTVRSTLAHYGQPGCDPHELFGPHTLKIIPSIPELDGADPARPDVRYVGSLLGDIHAPGEGDFTPEPGRRYVFAYVGMGSVSPAALKSLLPQVFPADGNTICMVGMQGLERRERIGAVDFRPYVPAGALLPHCDWTISHGGQNTITQSILNGVPLILFPGAIFERRFNAQKVAEAGAGLWGEVTDFNAAWLCAALARRAEFGLGVERLAARIRSYGGAAQAVEAITAWAAAGG